MQYHCGACKEWKPKNSFSLTQRKRGAKKCTDCCSSPGIGAVEPDPIPANLVHKFFLTHSVAVVLDTEFFLVKDCPHAHKGQTYMWWYAFGLWLMPGRPIEWHTTQMYPCLVPYPEYLAQGTLDVISRCNGYSVQDLARVPRGNIDKDFTDTFSNALENSLKPHRSPVMDYLGVFIFSKGGSDGEDLYNRNLLPRCLYTNTQTVHHILYKWADMTDFYASPLMHVHLDRIPGNHCPQHELEVFLECIHQQAGMDPRRALEFFVCSSPSLYLPQQTIIAPSSPPESSVDLSPPPEDEQPRPGEDSSYASDNDSDGSIEVVELDPYEWIED